MDTQQARQLLQKYNSGECTEAEKALVEDSLLAFNEQDIELSQQRLDEIAAEVYARLPVPRKNRFVVYLWSGLAAAAVLALLAIAHWKLEENMQVFRAVEIVRDIAPGGNRATLTLSGGKSIDLSGAKEGLIVADGKLRYTDDTPLENKLIIGSLSQTLSTPRGGQYQLVLGDGTRVWLNAASSISYPASFDGAKERRVLVNGEAYFEVAHNKAKPFRVVSGDQVIEVLGTHFNVNAYGDGGATVTTLLEGKVRLSGLRAEGENVVLAPLEQALGSGGKFRVGHADTELVMAWHHGRLEFKDADIRTIMKQVSRWYDVQVEFAGRVPDRLFTGSVARSSSLSVLLKILSYNDIKAKIVMDGPNKKLIVTP